MKLLFGLKVALIGMGVVFFALILLVIAIKALSFLLALFEKWEVRPRTKPVATHAEPVKTIHDHQTDGDDIAIAITAAVATYSQDR